MAYCKLTVVGAAVAASALLAPVSPALAIDCQDGYQLVQGNRLSTPYCQDDLLARVARQYGMKASAEEIRNNPNYKRHICRFVGRDIRVQENCSISNPTGRRG